MPLPQRLIDGVRREYTIGHLFEMSMVDPTAPNERQLLTQVLPPWQRPEVWTMEQKRRFIEGIFLGLGCGYYVVNGKDWNRDGTSLPMSGWLLDGQQRLSALRDFVLNGLVVFGDVTYAGLSAAQQRKFKNEGFPCFEISYTDDENALKELYDRLNFGGTPHTPEQRVLPDEV